MQYKIPVQIENEDTIFLGLSMRQLMIILIGGGIGYMAFQKIVGAGGPEGGSKLVGGIVFAFFFGVAVLIAKFKNHEMTFLPFILNWVRLRANGAERVWGQGVDSHPHLTVGHVASMQKAQDSKSGAKTRQEIYDNIEDKLKSL